VGIDPTNELDVTDLGRLDPHASTTEVTTWRGRKALRLEGLVILPTSLQEAHLTRRFEVKADEPLELTFGFSDELCLKLDDRVLFTGKNNFSGMSDRASRGYVEPGAYSVGCAVSPGVHRLSAELKVSEGFGWGLVVALRGSGVRWLPAVLG